MGDPRVRTIGQVDDGIAELPLRIGIDHDTVTVGCPGMTWRLTLSQAGELALLLVSACWEAQQQQDRAVAGLAGWLTREGEARDG